MPLLDSDSRVETGNKGERHVERHSAKVPCHAKRGFCLFTGSCVPDYFLAGNSNFLESALVVLQLVPARK